MKKTALRQAKVIDSMIARAPGRRKSIQSEVLPMQVGPAARARSALLRLSAEVSQVEGLSAPHLSLTDPRLADQKR